MLKFARIKSYRDNGKTQVFNNTLSVKPLKEPQRPESAGHEAEHC